MDGFYHLEHAEEPHRSRRSAEGRTERLIQDPKVILLNHFDVYLKENLLRAEISTFPLEMILRAHFQEQIKIATSFVQIIFLSCRSHCFTLRLKKTARIYIGYSALYNKKTFVKCCVFDFDKFDT